MSIHRILQFNFGEERDTEHRKQEQEQDEERTDIHQLWDGKDKCLENVL